MFRAAARYLGLRLKAIESSRHSQMYTKRENSGTSNDTATIELPTGLVSRIGVSVMQHKRESKHNESSFTSSLLRYWSFVGSLVWHSVIWAQFEIDAGNDVCRGSRQYPQLAKTMLGWTRLCMESSIALPRGELDNHTLMRKAHKEIVMQCDDQFETTNLESFCEVYWRLDVVQQGILRRDAMCKDALEIIESYLPCVFRGLSQHQR